LGKEVAPQMDWIYGVNYAEVPNEMGLTGLDGLFCSVATIIMGWDKVGRIGELQSQVWRSLYTLLLRR